MLSEVLFQRLKFPLGCPHRTWNKIPPTLPFCRDKQWWDTLRGGFAADIQKHAFYSSEWIKCKRSGINDAQPQDKNGPPSLLWHSILNLSNICYKSSLFLLSQVSQQAKLLPSYLQQIITIPRLLELVHFELLKIPVTLSFVVCNRPWLHIFLLAELKMWRSSLCSSSFEDIKLIADCHGEFAHPFLLLGCNCCRVSAPLPLISDRDWWGWAALLPEMLYTREEGSLTLFSPSVLGSRSIAKKM